MFEKEVIHQIEGKLMVAPFSNLIQENTFS